MVGDARPTEASPEAVSRMTSLDLAAIGRMFNRLTERHAERMARLGLDA